MINIIISIAIIILLILLILLLFFILYYKNSNSNSNNINSIIYKNTSNIDNFKNNSNVERKIIKIDKTIRIYLKINFNRDDILPDKILLCFPGGGESIYKFLNYTNFSKINNRIIIFEGQKSGNKHSFQNAFPWLFKKTKNDINFVDTVLDQICNSYNINIPKLFLTGKSDGGGFAILYANLSSYKRYIKAIGICSAAHFGINGMNNIQYFNNQNYINNGIIIPYNILLPPNHISIFIIHGTGDQVMPYNGQQYQNSSALKLAKKTIWKNIDYNLTNTYTPNIQDYFNKIISDNSQSYSTNTYSCQTSANKYNFITIFNQNHCWSGHTDSGPDSDKPSNMYLDATYLLSLFFTLDIENYTPTVDTIPSGLYNYNGNYINRQ
jgi:poly(3-hydroxybutyrate) depolymerase